MPTKPRRKTTTGSQHAKKAGLVPIALFVTPEEREEVRVAAARARCRSMGQFARIIVTSAAKKMQDGAGFEGLKKILEFIETF
jgi:hypothetical protein